MKRKSVLWFYLIVFTSIFLGSTNVFALNNNENMGSISDVAVKDIQGIENQWLIQNKLLKSNFSYESGEYKYMYTTDNIGRIKTFNTSQLQMTKREKRLPHASNSLDKLPGDHAGHIVADQFGGSPKLDNIVSQARCINLSTYKKLENLWAKSIKEGKNVQVEIILNYEDNARPISYDIGYAINGIYDSITIINRNP